MQYQNNNRRQNNGGGNGRNNNNRFNQNQSRNRAYAENSETVRSGMKNLEESYVTNEQVRNEYQSRCLHRHPNGDYALQQNKSNKTHPITGGQMLRCEHCKKEIDVSSISENEYDVAFTNIDRVIDIAKAHCSIEQDAAFIEEITRLQKLLHTVGKKSYIAATQKKKKKGGRGNGGGGGNRGGGRGGASMG